MKNECTSHCRPIGEKTITRTGVCAAVCVSQCLVWDYDSRGKHDFIGEFYTSFREMQKISSGNKVSEEEDWEGGGGEPSAHGSFY